MSSSPRRQHRSTVSPWCSAGKSIKPSSTSFTSAPCSALAALNYAARFAGSGNASSNAHNDVYSYSGFAGGMIVYAVWMGAVLWIASGRPDLLALRLPRPSLPRVAGYAAAAVAAIYVLEAIVSTIPLPQSPGKEQGLAP